MRELIERLEKATGSDRELDKAIALRLGWTYQKMKGDAMRYWREPGETEYYMRSAVPAYTASLDAALTLAGDKLHLVQLRHVGPDHWYAAFSDIAIGEREHESWCKTAALAISAAALKARQP